MEVKEKALSLFFNIDRTYVSLLDRGESNINLSYINSTESKIDLEDINSDISKSGIEQLNVILQNIEKPENVNVALPSESILVTTFPSKPDISHDEIVKLVTLEINQLYPGLNLDHFSIVVSPLAATKDGQNYMIASIINNEMIDACKQILSSNQLELGKIEISQFAAHNSFLFNYPEIGEQNVLMVSVQDQFMDISLLANKEIAYYNLVAVSDNSKIAEIFENECNNIQEKIVDQINQAFFFGSSLTKELNMMLWETSMLFGFETKRLNPFRMMSTSLDDRRKEYASRVFHLFPAVIGVNLPSHHHRIRIVS